MTSFINMMGTDRWSEADIVNRTEAMIAAQFTANDVAIINRKATAAALGQYTLDDDEIAEIARYNAVCLEAKAAGDVARADMALLAQVLDYEAARGVVDTADADVLALYAVRNPQPEGEA